MSDGFNAEAVMVAQELGGRIRRLKDTNRALELRAEQDQEYISGIRSINEELRGISDRQQALLLKLQGRLVELEDLLEKARPAVVHLQEVNANNQALNARLKSAISERDATIAQLSAQIASKDQLIKSHKRSLAIESMKVTGMRALINAFDEHHPESPLDADSDQIGADGQPKPLSQAIHDAAFDARGRALGFENPETLRGG